MKKAAVVTHREAHCNSFNGRRLTAEEEKLHYADRCIACGQPVDEHNGRIPHECTDCWKTRQPFSAKRVPVQQHLTNRYANALGYRTIDGGAPLIPGKDEKDDEP